MQICIIFLYGYKYVVWGSDPAVLRDHTRFCTQGLLAVGLKEPHVVVGLKIMLTACKTSTYGS